MNDFFKLYPLRFLLPRLLAAGWLSAAGFAQLAQAGDNNLQVSQSPSTAAKSAKPAKASTKPSAKPPATASSASKRKKNTASKVITGKAFGNSASVKQLAREIAQQQQLPAAWVQSQIASARLLPQILQMVLPPASPQQKNWNAYRSRFLTECRIQTGVRFWREHTLQLDRAYAQTGVDPRYIIGILGVESYYGQHQGQYKLLDALSTLSLHFPTEHPQATERRAFFQNELGFFLKQQFGKHNKPVLGSYAGASGWPQFMPSSIAKFAVDYDGDGRIDLINSASDAIGSVANYFKSYGWHANMPTHFSVDTQAISEADMAALLAPDIVPTWSASHLSDKKAVLPEEAKAFTHPLALVQLHNGNDAPTYVLGTDNFFVITRYNRSSYYALAVIELGEAVEQAMAERVDKCSNSQ